MDQTQINKAIFERLEKLESAVRGSGVKKIIREKSLGKLDFSRNERNFVKLHAGGMNGEKKFALLVARIAKGDTGVDIKTKDIETTWNKMKSKDLLGSPYNGKYATVAKGNGWVDSKKYGTYHITNSWKEIFDEV